MRYASEGLLDIPLRPMGDDTRQDGVMHMPSLYWSSSRLSKEEEVYGGSIEQPDTTSLRG